MIVQTKQERREIDTLQACHCAISLFQRWLLGTHAGAVRAKHLRAVDEFTFRYNRRETNKGVGQVAARVFEQLVVREPADHAQPGQRYEVAPMVCVNSGRRDLS